MQNLEEKNIEKFQNEGYIVLESFLDSEHIQKLKSTLDLLEEHRSAQNGKLLKKIIEYRELGLLTSEPKMINIVSQLMQSKYSLHHIHSVRQDAGHPGRAWHHDYEQIPQCNRSHLMLHVFYYLNGLNGEIGDLLILPGSHQRILERNALDSFGFDDLPGSLCIDELSPGSTVIVNSAVLHARRPKSGGENNPRYFIDVSYCQNGVIWPGYTDYEAYFKKALEMGLDRRGKYSFLYDSRNFFSQSQVRENFISKNVGSLSLQLQN